jgi:outer membrane protein OmpA-like peptidoglycan-associated protein
VNGPTRRRPGRSRARRSFDTWQIIYIDLMTNVMIFFVVLWAIHARQEKRAGGHGFGTETVKMVSLPGDVLFGSGKTDLSSEGQAILGKLFDDPTHEVLRFETGPSARRLLVVHGHTDGDGRKEQNLEIGYRRALSAYREILKYGHELADHVVLCTHADNSPAEEVPQAARALQGQLGAAEVDAAQAAKSKNRRITIEDKVETRKREGVR